jgi:tetratricopeptide (TPR) repeat protein
MNMCFSLGKIEEGLNVIKTWTEVDPGNAEAWKTMADYFSMAGQAETALNAADKLIALQPDSAANWESKARMLLGSDRAEEAVFACDRAIAINPMARQAWYLKAYALGGAEKYDEAVITCDKAIQLFPDDIEAYYTRACIFSRKGDVNNALADLGKTIEMDPSIRERAQEDPDFKQLYSDRNFQNLTGMSVEKADESALEAAVCSIKEKKDIKKDFTKKITGSWKADRAYIHGENLLGSRNFFFDFRKDGTISINEPERNWSESGTWKIGEKENTLEWTVSDKNSSFQGRYDFLEENLILSGQGFVGEFEHICLRLVR